MNPSTILIVEDQVVVALDLEGRLERNGYEVCGLATSGEEALSLARKFRPGLVLMDIRLQGELDGVQAAEILRAELDVPVIFLSAHSDEATLQRAKLTAPYGFLLKPFDERELQLNIEMALYKHKHDRQLASSQEQDRFANKTVAELVTHDQLTGLANRQSLAASFERDMAYAAQSGVPLSMLIIDIDRFKAINDRHGHIGGDVCLKALATTLHDSARKMDSVARTGGDKFVVLLPGSTASQALLIGEEIRQKVETLSITPFEGSAPMHFTISIGVVTADGNAQSFEQLIVRAVDALNRAKIKGRNQVAT